MVARKGLPKAQRQQMFEHVTTQAAGEGLHCDLDSLIVANSLRGHQLIHLARAHGSASDVKESLFTAHFEKGLNIGDVTSWYGSASAWESTRRRSAQNRSPDRAFRQDRRMWPRPELSASNPYRHSCWT